MTVIGRTIIGTVVVYAFVGGLLWGAAGAFAGAVAGLLPFVR